MVRHHERVLAVAAMRKLLLLGRPLAVAMLAVVASFVFSLWLSHRQLAGIEDEVHAIANNAQPSILDLDDARSQLEQTSVYVSEYLAALRAHLSTAPIAREKVLLSMRKVDRSVDAYVHLPFFPEEEKRFPAIRDELGTIKEALGAVLDRASSGDLEAANAAVTERLRPGIEGADDLIAGLVAYLDSESQARLAAIQASHRRGTTLATVLGTSSLALSVGAAALALMAIVRESTRMGALEAERARRATAEQEVRSRDDFLSLAAHELRTPLTALQLSIQSLIRTVPSPTELASTAARQARRLSDLVEELVEVSQIHLGHIKLTLAEVDLSALVRDVVASRSQEAKQAGTTVTISGDASVVGHWDRARLAHVISNLLANAMRFGRDAPIEITVERHDAMARLVVRDHGIGIPRGRLPFVFDLFDRAAPARNYGGLGLGLYVARALVEAHGGSIQVWSEEGVGSTFTVDLPLAGKCE